MKAGPARVASHRGEAMGTTWSYLDMAPLMIGSMFVWQQLWSGRPSERSKISAYVDRLLRRPAAIKVGGATQ